MGRLAVILAALGAGLILGTADAGVETAAVFTVNSTADGVDANVDDGVCATAAGTCTLRAAIEQVNVAALYPGYTSVNTITLPAGTYVLDRPHVDHPGVVLAAHDGTLLVARRPDLTIAGAGAGRTIVRQTVDDSVLSVDGSSTLVLSGLTITGGRRGGIFSAGHTYLDSVVVSGNSSTRGGGIWVGAFSSLTMTSSIVRDNSATGAGGILSEGFLTMRDSAVVGNTGGGIVVPFGYTTTADTGTQIDSSLVADNVGGGLAGQLDDGDTMLVRGSTIRGNTADHGGGLRMDGFGPVRMTIERSLLVGNTAATAGGGLYDQTAVDISNSTFSGNDSDAGGAISTDHSRGTTLHELTIDASTFADNTAGRFGSGISIDADYTTTVGRTILANSPASQNCNAFPGTLHSAGDNIDSGTSCSFAAAGDRHGVDPRLQALAGNGGPTQTQKLRSDSPAIDAVMGACPPPGIDQRGAPRPFGSRCDVGAFERGATPPSIFIPPAFGVRGDVRFGGGLLALSPVFAGALAGHMVPFSAEAPARRTGAHSVSLRAVSGFVGNQVSDLVLRGGFRLGQGKKELTLRDLLVDFHAGRVLAPLGKDHAWACLATFDEKAPRRTALRIDGKLRLRLCASAAATLDRFVGTKALHGGTDLGTLTVGARFQSTERLPKPAPPQPQPSPPPETTTTTTTTTSTTPAPPPSFHPSISVALDKQKALLTIGGSGWDPCDNAVTLFLKNTKLGTAKTNVNGAFDASFFQAGAASGDEVRAEQSTCAGGQISAKSKVP